MVSYTLWTYVNKMIWALETEVKPIQWISGAEPDAKQGRGKEACILNFRGASPVAWWYKYLQIYRYLFIAVTFFWCRICELRSQFCMRWWDYSFLNHCYHWQFVVFILSEINHLLMTYLLIILQGEREYWVTLNECCLIFIIEPFQECGRYAI